MLGDRVIPELLDGRSDPNRLAGELIPLLMPGAARERQLRAFEQLDRIMAFEGKAPSVCAAETIMRLLTDRGLAG